MANTLLSKTFNGGTNYSNTANTAVVYTVPTSTTTIVIGFTISNITTSAIATNVKIYDDDASQTIHFLKNVAIDTGSTLEIMGGNKIILNANDAIQMTADTVNSFDVLISMVEQT
tara:strand:- start:12865 stop:13209 length:345 start_codon:yes stop_codon:yes gene_type:complete